MGYLSLGSTVQGFHVYFESVKFSILELFPASDFDGTFGEIVRRLGKKERKFVGPCGLRITINDK